MNSTRAMEPRTLLLLTAAVLLAHWFLLSSFFFTTPLPIRASPLAFQSRLITEQEPPITQTRPERTAKAPAPDPTTGQDANPTSKPAVKPAQQEGAAAALAVKSGPSAEVVRIALPGARKLGYELVGSARGVAYSGESELLWQHDQRSYSARALVTSPQGSRLQTSVGALTPQGLAPRRFGDKRASEVATHFEWDKGIIIFSANTRPKTLLPGAQDYLSLYLQLASLLAGEPSRYTKGSLIAMQVAGPRDAELWQFEVEGEELLKLPGGEIAAIKLRRAAQRDFDLTLELWLAAELDYLPARIRLTLPNGDFSEQFWRGSETP
jgi:hypothetical protein